ncbi:roadblock/LC7 domain-containing protein [Streptomyces sp. 7N604]
MSTGARNLDWLINDFVDQVPAIASAAVLTSDGLLLAMSAALSRNRAEQLAAVSSGFAGLTREAARIFDAGGVVQTMVELRAGYFFIMAISDSSFLAVLASSACDMDQVGFEMTALADRCGEWLTPAVRTELREAMRR